MSPSERWMQLLRMKLDMAPKIGHISFFFLFYLGKKSNSPCQVDQTSFMSSFSSMWKRRVIAKEARKCVGKLVLMNVMNVPTCKEEGQR